MSNSIGQMVKQFNTTYGVVAEVVPKVPDEDKATRLNNLIHEELMELNEALDSKDVIGIADALADIIYVTAQQAEALGFPVDAMLREVHRSNMSKLGEDGKPIYREDGKVLKGPNFTEPDLEGVLSAYALVGRTTAMSKAWTRAKSITRGAYEEKSSS